MRTKLSLALSALLAAFLFAGAATAAPGHGSTIHRLIPEAGIQRDLITNVKFAYSKKKKSRKFAFSKKKKRGKSTFSKKKKSGKFAFSKRKKPGKFAFPKKRKHGKFAFSKKKNPRVFAPPKKKKGDNGDNSGNSGNSQPTPPTYEELLEAAGYDGSGTPPTYEELLEAAGYDGSGTPPTYEELLEDAGYDSSLVGNGGNGGDNDDKDHNTNGHQHGFPGLGVGLGFGDNVTEAAPAVPDAGYPMACVAPSATQPTLLNQVAARLALLNELNRQGVIKDDDYEIQKTVVLLSLAQEVGVADALQVIKCIEAQDLIGDNEYDAKRKEFVAIQ